jgi:putative ATP-binding cassette transporter
MKETPLAVGSGPFLKRLWRLVVPYWKSEEKARAWWLLAAIVAFALGLVYLEVLFNSWNRFFYNALEQKNFADFKDLLLYFSFLAALYIAAAIYRLYLQQMLEMRWRAWLTRRYLSRWLSDRVYYRIELESRVTDNPDQRIAEDLRLFTTGTLTLGLGLLSSVVTLVSFVVILWTLSGPLVVPLGASTFTIPGYMVWCALVYAVAGSVLTHLVGRPLIPLNFQQERLEADFRFNLVRLRENAEGVALYAGESQEQAGLLARFERIRENWWGLMGYTKRLTTFTVGYSQIAIIFPFLVAAPRYFAGEIDLGTLMQISSAFGTVQAALSWFVSSYSSLANWKASVDRLLTFHDALAAAAVEQATASGVEVQPDADKDLKTEDLNLMLPNGRTILSNAAFGIERGDRVLISGSSGSGKSTLFRAIAGIWPFGRGRVHIPRNAKVLFLPQKPYIPIGTLRHALAYPAPPETFSDDALRVALADVQLDGFGARLDQTENWSMQMSGGEQQKLALARALLHRPDWLFLDEATASLDEATERHVYEVLRVRLPDATLVSIAHRPGVADYHRRRLRFEAAGEGMRLVASSA